MNSVRLRRVMMVAMLAAASSRPIVVFAQEAAAAGGDTRQCSTVSAPRIGLGMIVIGAALGIGRFAAAAAEGIARQPAAAAQITGAVNLPLFLLEGVAILAEVFVLLIVLMNGRA